MCAKRILSSIFALILMFGFNALSYETTNAITRLGGVSVYDACRYQYSAAYAWEVFVLPDTYNVMGWRCYLNHIHSGYVELDLNAECRREYGSLARATYDDFNDPYSWYCYK